MTVILIGVGDVLLFLLVCSLLFPVPEAIPSSKGTRTIPAFPEEADVAGCPLNLNLSDEHYEGIKEACGFRSKKELDLDGADREVHRSRCCPVLAAWLYSAYSATALGVHSHATSYAYDMPLLPDDSETCVTDLVKAFQLKGIQLLQPNETCDLVYCYCGIRLHPFTCPESFSVTPTGTLLLDQTVKTLERDCFPTTTHVNQLPALPGCSNCLHTLYSLRKKSSSNSSKSEDRTTKIHNKDCELMGLTWLLAKNRTAYIHTVSGVLRALMLSTEGSDPQSCTLNSDGMPLAVDSSEMSDQSSSTNLQAPIFLSLLVFLYTHFSVLST
ncbi:hypothetical protein VNO78_09987 [Psophocarpus tetragonolobus]|uniref:SPARK domain-containing protein n=1 Tax=Psophocarpus tetragonolobus TaxID=3891 RepID=A0AAN9XMB9_PSOTE